VLGHVTTHDPHRGIGVPHRVVEQPLGPVGRGVAGMLGDGPAVLAWQVADQGAQVFSGLLERLHARETRSQPSV
jgi:hypothetical protein